MTQENLAHEQHCHSMQRISWSAIMAGALVGVGLGFLLNVFGMAIGLSAFSMSDHGVATLAIGGLLGLIVSTIVSLFFAGYTSGYLGRLYVPHRNLGFLYGFTTWSVSIILAALLTTYIGHYVDSYSNNVTGSTVVIAQEIPVAPKMTTPTKQEQKLQQQQQQEAMVAKEATVGMATGAFIVFALFFLGALSSCTGAHFGMSSRCKE